jgi:cytoskeletal protein CcmA (bactofilin family)
LRNLEAIALPDGADVASFATGRHGIGLTLLCRWKIENNVLTISREQAEPGTPSLSSSEEPTLSSVSVAAIHEATPSNTSPAPPTAADPATIGESLQIKGEVIGSESLYIDGNVEGAISLPDSRVTVSRDALVSANITAREVVVFGKVSGNIYASDRVDIRSEGSLTGDVTAQRISVGDGAFLQGRHRRQKTGKGKDGMVVAGISNEHLPTAASAVQA